MSLAAPLSPLGLSARPGTRPELALSGPEKAAIVVRFLLAEGMELPLRDLPEGIQAALTLQIGRMPAVDRDTVDAVVEEFLTHLDGIGLSFPAGLEGALDLVQNHVSPGTLSRLRLAAGGGAGEDPWPRIGSLEADRLLPVLAEESPEVAAIVLSKIAVSKAADLLGRMPGDKARRIAYAVSLTAATPPEIVERIGRALLGQLAAERPRAFDTGPVERVGAILNFSPAATRDAVLQGLTETDAGFADEVRRAIFTFANIPSRIDPRDIPKILRAVDRAVLVAALAGAAGAEAPAAEFILSNISQRMAQSLREEMAAVGKQTAKDVEEAMGAIVAGIRALESAGEIFLVAVEEEEAD